MPFVPLKADGRSGEEMVRPFWRVSLPTRSGRPRRAVLWLRLAPLLVAGWMALAVPLPSAAAVPTWQAVYDRAQAAYAANDLGTAEQASRAALAQARAGQGDNRPYVASSLNVLALVRQRQGHVQDAADLLREAVAMAGPVPGGETNTAALTLNLGQVLEALGRSDDALAAYRRSLEAADRLPPQALTTSRRIQAQMLAALSRLHDTRGEAAQAMQYNERLLTLRPHLAPSEQAQALLRQARLYEGRGQGDAAVATLREALSLDGRPAELEALSALAALYRRLERSEEAVPLHQRAVELLENTAPRSTALASHLNELGLWHLQHEEYAIAQSLLMRAQAIVTAQDPTGLEAARITANLAQLHEARAEDAQAQLLFRQALATYEAHGGLPEALLGQAQALNYLAGQDYLRRRTAQAEAQFLRALALTEQASGPQSLRLLPLLDNLVTLYLSQKRHAMARPFAERAENLRKLH